MRFLSVWKISEVILGAFSRAVPRMVL
uniref:Uncharacterized protein n=1 Tax=Anguilla anguilla TaxID=7936 RepID=A0A0E9TGW9_ANGAN